MYTQKDFDKAKRGMLLRMGLTLCMVALVCVGCGLCMHYRIRWANALIAGAGMAAAAVYFTLKAMPWWRYFRLMRDIETGRSHEYDVRFLSFSSDVTLRDGVRMHALTAELMNAEDEDKERLYFWDDDKPAPALSVGQPVHIRTFGNYITALEPIAQEG